MLLAKIQTLKQKHEIFEIRNCWVVQHININSLMSLRHFDVLTISGYKIFFSTNIYSNKLCNISFERAQNMLYRKK